MRQKFYHSIISIPSYFKPADNESLFGEAVKTNGAQYLACITRELNALKRYEKKETKKRRQVAPEDMKREVVFYGNKHGIPAARK